MRNGKVSYIFITDEPRTPMIPVREVLAIATQGLQGDRYASGNGSHNKGEPGQRQVTLINERFIRNSGFNPIETRRNLVVENVELMWLIGREFQIGEAKFHGMEYCDPCRIPRSKQNRALDFSVIFEDCGGLIANVIQTGQICVGDAVIPPPKNY